MSYTRAVDFMALSIIVPLLVITYLTSKTALGRFEDAVLHVDEVNRLYLSTIETLATAIDAKDQVTHGHIRRVQRFALGLAAKLGITDPIQLKALKAAALLRDMGKIAVPEHILNKPSRLTAGEFENMKLHASVGADILSSIKFPYPVVPIVRHHHESWDGTGYPDGLRTTQLPLGARILAVVDCFDALTSDRPYRTRLSDPEAIAILMERRGVMYDPMVVDKFIETQKQLSEEAQEQDVDKDAIDSIATKLRITPEAPAPTLADVSDRLPVKVLTLLRSIHPSPPGVSVEDLGVIVSKQFLRLTNALSIAIYGIGESGHSIRCLFADEPLSQLVGGPDILLGERLSGWVAAHRTPIWNSDAALDLPTDLARSAGVGLGSSVPLVDGDVVIGTLIFYAPRGLKIAVEQRVLIQSAAPLLATALSTSIAHDQVASIDGTSRSSRETLYAVLDALLSHRAHGLGRTHPEALSIVLVTFPSSVGPDRNREALQSAFRADLASATGASASVVRLASNEMLITAPLRVLANLGLDVVATPRTADMLREMTVIEVANSLQLREVLGLTRQGELQPTRKPLVH